MLLSGHAWEDWGSGGGVCVGGGAGGEAISKLKGAGATHALPRSYLCPAYRGLFSTLSH